MERRIHKCVNPQRESGRPSRTPCLYCRTSIQIQSFDSRVIRAITHLAADNILAVSDVARYDNEALRPCVPGTSECIVKMWPCIYLGIFNLIGPISTAVNIIWPKIAATVNTNHLFKLRNLYRGVLCLGARDVLSLIHI